MAADAAGAAFKAWLTFPWRADPCHVSSHWTRGDTGPALQHNSIRFLPPLLT